MSESISHVQVNACSHALHNSTMNTTTTSIQFIDIWLSVWRRRIMEENDGDEEEEDDDDEVGG